MKVIKLTDYTQLQAGDVYQSRILPDRSVELSGMDIVRVYRDGFDYRDRQNNVRKFRDKERKEIASLLFYRNMKKPVEFTSLTGENVLKDLETTPD